MFITCPNCRTSYGINPASLGATGKTVRCSACGHQWHQGPEAPPPPPAPPSAPPPAVYPPQTGSHPPPGAYPPGYPPPGAYPPGYPPPGAYPPGYPPPGAYPPPETPPPAARPPAPPPPDPPAPEPEPEPEPESESVAVSDFDFPDDGEESTDFESLDSADLAPDSDFEAPAEDAAADFDESVIDEPDPGPVTSYADDVDDDLSRDTHDEPDALPDPEPIPQVFSGEAPSPERKGGVLRIVLVAVAVLTVAAGMGGFLFRDQVVALWPGAEALYASMGMREALGAGLNVVDTRTEFATEGDGDTMVVRGVIVNTTDLPRPVPNLKIVLLDAGDTTVQSLVIGPTRPEIEPAGRQRFRAVVRNMALTARRMEVQFTEDPPTE